MDLDGPNARFDHRTDRTHPGQYHLVSKRWSEDNAAVLREVYGTAALESAQPVQGGRGTLQLARHGDRTRLSLLVVHDVGHAWPAGSGMPNDERRGGKWMAQSGLNYPEFVAGWLIAHNPRLAGDGSPQVTLGASVVPAAGRAIELAGTASDSDGSIKTIDTVLLKASAAGAFLRADDHAAIDFAADGSYRDRYPDLPDGRYRVQVTATDNAGLAATSISPDLTIGQPPAPEQCREFTDHNFNHVARGRAALCSFGFACAKGSGDNLGLFSVGVVSTVNERGTSPGVFRKGACALPQS